MRDEQHGDLAFEFVDGGGEVFGGLHVEVAHGFVEDEYARMFEQGTSDGDALFLSASLQRAYQTSLQTSLAHLHLVASCRATLNCVRRSASSPETHCGTKRVRGAHGKKRWGLTHIFQILPCAIWSKFWIVMKIAHAWL